MRELLNDERKFVKLNSLRTRDGGRWVCGEDDKCAADNGEVGVRKLSFLPRLGSDIAGSVFSFSISMAAGVAGWDVRGPPPGVGGSRVYAGGSVGGGILVPSVRL